MSILKYIHRFERMHSLIRRKSTGSPEEFAQKMNISRSALMRHLSEIRKLNAPVAYDDFRQSYYYTREVEMNFGFRKLEASKMEKQAEENF